MSTDPFDLTKPENKDLDERALASISLSVKPSLYLHINTCDTAKKAWDALKAAFEDTGLIRKIHLRRELNAIKFKDCRNMEDYLNRMLAVSQELSAINAEIPGDELAIIILSNLPDSYDPLVIALENCGTALTATFIRSRLLQEEARRHRSNTRTPEDTALSVKPSKNSVPTCYACKKPGHKYWECPKNKKKSNPNSGSKSEPSTRGGRNSKNALLTVDPTRQNQGTESEWYVDSGATCHMSGKRDWFNQLDEAVDSPLRMANNSVSEAQGVGDIDIELDINGDPSPTVIENVLYAPTLRANLLSVGKLTDRGYQVDFTKSKCKILGKNGEIIATATRKDGLYKLDMSRENELNTLSVTSSTNDPPEPEMAVPQVPLTTTHPTKSNPSLTVWHSRFAHLSVGGLKRLISNGMVEGLSCGDTDETSCGNCAPCALGKQHRIPFPRGKAKRANELLELVHSDLCGPMSVDSIGGGKYFLTFIDDKSRWTKVYILKSKSEVFETFREYKAEVENQTGKKIKTLRSDNGTEYVNHAMINYLKLHGIRFEKTVPYTPEQNGVAERSNRTVVEKARCMLEESNLDRSYWAEAVNTAVYLKNRSPTIAVSNVTPEESWTGRKPDVSNLRIFGCKAFAHVPKANRRKLDPKSTECVFVGYCETSKGYRLIDKNTKKLIVSRDVIFFESAGAALSESEIRTCVTADLPVRGPNPTQPENDDDVTMTPTEDSAASSDPRKSKRVRYPTYVYGEEYVNLVLDGPEDFDEAINGNESEKWRQAVDEEMNSIMQNETWDLVTLPKGRKAIKSKWVFKRKTDATGKVIRHKARLVAKGFQQKQGIDYTETFSPVMKFNTMRTVMALACEHELEVHQLDVDTAFLYGELDEDIYMEQPEGFVQPGSETKVCKLKKCLYGLKQAGRVWYERLDSRLKQAGLKQSTADQCLYFKIENGEILIVTVYVDDLIVAANNVNKISELKATLSQEFRMKDLGEIHHCLGIRITRDREKGMIELDQQAYIQQIIDRFGMSNANPVSTPMDCSQKLTKEMSPKSDAQRDEMRNVPYLSAVGSLMYAAMGTRPDIAHAVAVVSQYSSDPGQAHWTAVKRIIRYLKGTQDLKLAFVQSSSPEIEGYCDSDWANDLQDRKSITGYVFRIGGAAISWCSKKQPTVATSTTEAEYMSLSQATKEAVWLKRLYNELNPGEIQERIVLNCDNQGAINISKNAVHHGRTKHIDIQHHFVRERVVTGDITVEYVATEGMVADVLTKALPRAKHQWCTKELGLSI